MWFYNKEGLNHVHACMCQYDFERESRQVLEKQIHGRISHMKENNETDMDVSV